MNPDNNNIDQPTGQSPQQLPAPPQPWQQPPNPSVVVPPTMATPPAGRNSRPIILIIVLVVAAIISLGGWLLLSKSSENGSTPVTTAVPKSWETLDTQLGFTVDAPAGWSVLRSFEAKVNNLASNYVSLGQANESASETPLNITASILERTDTTDKQSLVDAVTDEEAIAKNYGLTGDETTQVDVTDSVIDINGKEWLKIDLTVNDNSTTILYYWAGTHAIGLSSVGSGDPQKDTAVYKNYLLPMAASMKD